MKHFLSIVPLLIVIVGLPQLSETIYTPSLPDIAHSLRVSEAWVEYTLTIYLAGFAIGTLFWGRISDRIGRKPSLLLGFMIYVLGCIGCFFSGSIEMLMISRFFQAFGGSTGSVVGQAVCRDAFQGVQRGKVFSTIGSVISFSPAIGPVLGGVIDQAFGWSSIFLLLIIIGGGVMLAIFVKLPETHAKENRHPISLKNTALRLITDPKVVAYGIIVAGCNGILFSFYAEGSFYLIEMLGLTPSTYGASFIGMSLAGVAGGWTSRRMHNHSTSIQILKRGLLILILGSVFFTVTTFIFGMMISVPKSMSITLTIVSMMIITFGSALAIPNSLSVALEDYKHAVGTASSLFGLFYYTIISLATLGMGILHNGTLYPMPIYFAGMAILMWVVYAGWIARKKRN